MPPSAHLGGQCCGVLASSAGGPKPWKLSPVESRSPMGEGSAPLREALRGRCRDLAETGSSTDSCCSAREGS